MSHNWKDTIQKWFKNLLLPDLNKRITWYLVVIGTGILITPTALEEYIFRWIFEYLNSTKLSEQKINFTIENNNPTVGLVIIILALIHNLTLKYLETKDSPTGETQVKEKLSADQKTFNDFIKFLPTNSNEMKFLKRHDFGNQYYSQEIQKLYIYNRDWNIPERQFFDEEIEHLRKEFNKDISNLIVKLFHTAVSVGPDMMSVIPNEHKVNEFNIPEYILNNVRDVNDLASKAFKSHQELILLCRQRLSV